MSGLYLETCTSNLKYVFLTILELLAFYPKNLGGQETLAMPPFEKFLRGHMWTNRENMHVKFDVHSFNRFGAISI